MTFKHKLSCRLALLKDRRSVVSTAVFALVAIAACEKPVHLTDPGTGTVSRLVISPKILTLRQNQSSDLTAVGLTSVGDTASVVVSWSTTGGSITATSTTGGMHYGRYQAGPDTGKVRIVVTGQPAGPSDTAIVTVTQVPVASVAVSPASPSLQIGQAMQLAATPQDAGGTALSGRAVTWATSNTAVATVSGSGLVTGVTAGTATITATSEGKNGSATVTVTNVPVASVAVSPAASSVPVGQTGQLTATPQDAGGTALSGRAVTWATSNAAVATVSGSGLVTGVTAGTATITATSEGKNGSATVTVTSGAPGQVTYYRTNFTDGTTGPLDVYAYGGGSCGPSTDYRDAGSAASIKCTIPAIDYGAAALQAWFGHGRLSGLPSDPSLDQDLFQEVRFVLAPGAAGAIGGTACTVLNPSSQFKVHKSVYGQAGSAVNGWVMSAIGPCSDGGRLGTEAEMWNIDGRTYPWSSASALLEGSVYDVIYRYHRYTAQGCGTIAVWVNGTKVWDSPCQSYLGTTNGSTQGLLFWDGATYLQSGLTALTVYTLFTQATNYPIGAATASP